MGTSQSSKGPSGGVPMVPPWVPDPAPPGPPPPLPAADGDGTPSPADNDGQNPPPSDQVALPQQPSPGPAPVVAVAPAGRFLRARRRLGRFAKSGDSADMRRGVGSYIRGGYGGG